MDYSQLSDFEINSAVHNAKLKEPYALVFMGDDRIAWTKENGDQIITEKVPYTKNGVHDYCNNPADAWPIIVENKIGLTPPMHDENWEAMTFDKFGYVNKNEYNANPLRAAMIVFLLIKEKK